MFPKGEVEQIAMMKPKGQTEHDEGMLEYLEDLIGSARLKEPIHSLCRRVELLNERRGETVRLHLPGHPTIASKHTQFLLPSLLWEPLIDALSAKRTKKSFK